MPHLPENQYVRRGIHMAVFNSMETHGYEQAVFNYDKVSGLRTIIAIHDTTLGPSLGGARMWPYKSEEEALQMHCGWRAA